MPWLVSLDVPIYLMRFQKGGHMVFTEVIVVTSLALSLCFLAGILFNSFHSDSTAH